MSDINKDGGPAFPLAFSTAEYQTGNINPGMSLRAWFAGQAMAGWLANPHITQSIEASLISSESFAIWAVACADALIAELNKP